MDNTVTTLIHDKLLVTEIICNDTMNYDPTQIYIKIH